MNQDDRIDELLSDLDTALSVEPSPAVAAKVRARIASEPARGWWSWAFVGQTFRSAAYALVLVIAVAAAYLMWPRTTPVPVPHQVAAQPPSTTVPVAATTSTPPSPAVASVTSTPRPKVTRSTPVLVAAAEREPEVLVSPGIRLALAQFDALTRGSVAVTEPQSGMPETIEPAMLAIDVVKIEPPGQTSSGGGTVRK